MVLLSANKKNIAVVVGSLLLPFVVVGQPPEGCSPGFEWCPAYDDCIRPAREVCPDGPDPDNIVGDDVDEFGCKPSAGEEWCAPLRECIRPFIDECPVPIPPTPVPVAPPTPKPVPSPTQPPVDSGSGGGGGSTPECAAGLEWCAAYSDCIRPAREQCPPGGDRDEYGCIPSAGEKWCEPLDECYRPFDGESCEQPTKAPVKSPTKEPVQAPTPQILGGDRDEYGCIPSAGYEWCDTLAECIRPWETSCPDEILGGDRDEHGCIQSAGYEWCDTLAECIRPWETTCPDKYCKTLAEIVCESPDLSQLCNFVKKNKLADKLSKGSWTVFAPRNGGFDDVPTNKFSFDRMRGFLTFHLVKGKELYAKDLKCNSPQNLVEMSNGFDSRTTCKNGKPAYQKGRENKDKEKPRIVSADIEACNGVAHIVNSALLYKDY